MNTVLSFDKKDKTVHFTYRGDEFRVIINYKTYNEKTLIGRLTIPELKNINNERFEIIHTLTSSIQNAMIIYQTFIDHNKKTISLILKNNEIVNIYFNSNEWEQIFNYINHGKEENLLTAKQIEPLT